MSFSFSMRTNTPLISVPSAASFSRKNISFTSRFPTWSTGSSTRSFGIDFQHFLKSHQPNESQRTRSYSKAPFSNFSSYSATGLGFQTPQDVRSLFSKANECRSLLNLENQSPRSKLNKWTIFKSQASSDNTQRRTEEISRIVNMDGVMDYMDGVKKCYEDLARISNTQEAEAVLTKEIPETVLKDAGIMGGIFLGPTAAKEVEKQIRSYTGTDNEYLGPASDFAVGATFGAVGRPALEVIHSTFHGASTRPLSGIFKNCHSIRTAVLTGAMTTFFGAIEDHFNPQTETPDIDL